MQYIAYAQRAEYEKCARASFACTACGICAARCPAGISHPHVAMLARRLTGKYILPETEHNKTRTEDIGAGKFDKLIEEIMNMPLDKQKELYNTREIEK
jgi:Fe-S oxidoreductase